MKTRTLTNKRWLPLAIVPLFSVAILAGCSSDDDDNTGAAAVVTDADGDGTPDAFQVAALGDIVDADGDGFDDRDTDTNGFDDRDNNGNGIADQYETPTGATAIAADANANFIDDSYEASLTGGDDTNNDGIDDAAAALLAGGVTTAGTTTAGGETAGDTAGSTTTGDTAGSTTTGDTAGGTTSGDTAGGTTSGDTAGGTTSGDTAGGTTTGGTTGGGTEIATGSLDGITFGSNPATPELIFDGTRITGSVNAPDAVEVALFSGIAASAGNVQRILNLNGSAPTFFMPNPLSDQENAPVIENLLSGSLYLQLTTTSGEIIRSDQVLPPGNVVSTVFTPLEVETGSGFSSNGAGFIHVNTVSGQYTSVATVNLDVSDLGSDANPISVAAANIHSGSPAGAVIVELTMDTSTSFSATGTLSPANLQTIQQNNGWFNITQNDGNTPGADFVTGQIVFTQP